MPFLSNQVDIFPSCYPPMHPECTLVHNDPEWESYACGPNGRQVHVLAKTRGY